MTGSPAFGIGRIHWGWFIVGSLILLLARAIVQTASAMSGW